MSPIPSQDPPEPAWDFLSRLLGKECLTVADSVRIAHRAPLRAAGNFDVHIPFGFLGSWIARRLCLPPRGKGIPIELVVTVAGDSAEWERHFGDFVSKSRMRIREGSLEESAGSSTFKYTLEVVDGGVRYRQIGFSYKNRPWPIRFSPTVSALVLPGKTGWQVEVRVRIPILGEICHYHGEMALR